ncbi:MAG: ATP-binding protein [Nitrospira sp.]|nr:ATP-binding protein [Nitrospira sp.]
MKTPDTREQHDRGLQSPARLFSLRMKFVVFFSLILIATCSSLSWYFIENRRTAMAENLQELGVVLLNNTVHNDHFRIGGVVLEDRETLDQFMQSLLAIDHVSYVIITAADGRILDRQTKRWRHTSDGSHEKPNQPIYPDDRLSASLLQTPLTTPLITTFHLSPTQRLIPENTSGWFPLFSVWQETLFDFAMPVLRESGTTMPSRHAVEFDELIGPTSPASTSPIVGLVRIGITDTQARQALLIIIRNVSILTLLIIAAGIFGAHLLTSRITTPLRSLAAAARQLAAGNATPMLPTPTTYDEVGQLIQLFNVMAQSLYDRNKAINMNIETISRQIKQLTTVHQASTAIAGAGTLDMNHLLDTLLHLLVENLGFVRMAVVLHHPEEHRASVAKTIGTSPDIAEAARKLDIPVADNGSFTADLILHDKPLLIDDLDTVAQRIHPPALELMRRSDVRSLTAVPLKSHAKNIGYLMADRGPQPCNKDDLHILSTIAGHVAAAIDNAKAYSKLTELTQHLEERIEQRTQELSLANTQLQEHDRRRSKFLSVVSHELRTPMTAIRSFSENMLDGITGPLTELQQTYLIRTRHNVSRLERIIGQLLDWSRLDTKNVEPSLEHVSIPQLAMIVVESLQTVAAEKEVSVTIAPMDTLPLVIGDRDKLEQILWNLIGNAIKFTPPGGCVTVECRLSHPHLLETCVSDTGCGIAPADVPNIFDEFSRIPSAMPASQGAQLGLCITKTLVTMHHGEIRVESRPGFGSRFYFTLPTVEASDQPA